MKIQSYKNGIIDKNGNSYSYIVNGKVKGTYASVDLLVKGVLNGEQKAEQKAIKRKKRIAEKSKGDTAKLSEQE